MEKKSLTNSNMSQYQMEMEQLYVPAILIGKTDSLNPSIYYDFPKLQVAIINNCIHRSWIFFIYQEKPFGEDSLINMQIRGC